MNGNAELLYSSVSLGRHKRHCTVCHHPECQAIENMYLDWHSPEKIATLFGITEDAIYRHVRALGLVRKRRQNRIAVIERILERSGSTPVSPEVALAAVKLLDKLCAAQVVEQVEPPDSQILTPAVKKEESGT